MNVWTFITYCSKNKDRSPTLLPALKRYRSIRIKRVKEAADLRDAAFYILSGEFGLLKAFDPIPYYDHLLQGHEVAQLSKRVARQLGQQQIGSVRFFVSPTRGSQVAAYGETIRRACKKTGIEFKVVMLEAENMSDWRKTIAEARSAKALLLQDRIAGEKRFQQVFDTNGEDGMIYFIRGEGYESLAENESALNDYRLAEILFPLPKYKDQARRAALHIEARLLPTKKPQTFESDLQRILKTIPDSLIVKAVEDAIRLVESDPADAVRAVGERGIRGLIMHLERENRLEPLASWRQRTKQLSETKVISEVAAYEMDAVREIRNKVASEGASVTSRDAEASVKMFIAALANVFASKV
jgi:hypothetical protein